MSNTDSSFSLTDAASMAGAVIRYAFYAAGAFALIAVVIIPFLRSDPVRPVDDKPAFRLASPELARLPTTAQIITGRGARLEMRQYGRLYDRDKDLTVLMVMPPKGAIGAREFSAEIRDLGSLRSAGATFSNTFHDLVTRFGAVRAQEFYVDADGRRKLCLAYLSRFDTAAIYLKGWYCEGNGAKAGSYELACDLDSLVIDAPLASAEADAFMRERMKRQRLCSAAPVTQTTDTRPYSYRPYRR